MTIKLVADKNLVGELLARLGWSQVEAARRLGVTDRTMRRWVQSRSAPGPARILLYMWAIMAIMRRCNSPVDADYFSGRSPFGELSEKELASEFQRAVALEDRLIGAEARDADRQPGPDALGDWLVSISRPGVELDNVLEEVRNLGARAADLKA